MTQIALASESQEPRFQPVPVTELTPMQMAYQLVASGRDFASVREMIEYSKKLEADEAAKAFSVALVDAQAEMGRVAANKDNSQTKSRYADYAQLDRTLRPIYTKHGFALSFDEEPIDKPDYVRIVCHVSHRAGHTRLYRKDMPADGKGAKGGDVMTKTHAAGAAQSYAMRYILRGIFNVAVGDEDTDGNMPGDTISMEQLEELQQMVTDTKSNIVRLCKFLGVEALAQLPAAQFGKAKAALSGAFAGRAK